MNNDNLNSKEYWDHRFETDWEAMHGREQSQFFAKLALEHFPSWFFYACQDARIYVLRLGLRRRRWDQGAVQLFRA